MTLELAGKNNFLGQNFFGPNQKLQIRVLLIPKYKFQVNLMGGMNFSGWLKAPKAYWRIAFIIWIIQFVYLAFGRTASCNGDRGEKCPKRIMIFFYLIFSSTTNIWTINFDYQNFLCRKKSFKLDSIDMGKSFATLETVTTNKLNLLSS